jgi:hypothetical protein
MSRDLDSDDDISDCSEDTYNSDEDEEEVEVENGDQEYNKKKKKINGAKKLELKDAVKTVEERSLYVGVERYFKNECTIDQIEKMIRIIDKEDRVSLRLLNWFSMKYSSSMEGLETKTPNGKVEIFHVRISYKARLKAHSKKYFDPFRRGKRFDYHYDNNDQTKFIETTLCQLNFFKWLFTHKLIDYVDTNFDTLAKRMATYEKKKKDVKKKEKVKKETILKDKKDNIKIKVKKFTEDDNVRLILDF